MVLQHGLGNRPGKANVFEYGVTRRSMQFHLQEFFRVEPSGLVQYFLRNSHLADIVKKRRHAQCLKLVFVPSHLASNSTSDGGDEWRRAKIVGALGDADLVVCDIAVVRLHDGGQRVHNQRRSSS